MGEGDPIPLQVFLDLERAADRPEHLQIHNKMLYDAVNGALLRLYPRLRDGTQDQDWVRAPFGEAVSLRRPRPTDVEDLAQEVLQEVLRWDRVESTQEDERLEWVMTEQERLDAVLHAEMRRSEVEWTHYQKDLAAVAFEIADSLLQDAIDDTVQAVQHSHRSLREDHDIALSSPHS